MPEHGGQTCRAVLPRGRERNAAVRRVLWVVLLLNIAVAAAKLACGFAFTSESMRADGIHSLFDSTGNIVGLVGMAITARPADASHPYGHGKYETFASVVIGILLLGAAWEIGSGAVSALASGSYSAQVTPVSFGVMLATLAVNCCVTAWEHRRGRQLASSVLVSDAKHTLSDVLVSLSVIVGLVFVAAGFPLADAIAALVVTVAILATGVSVLKEAQDTLSDEARIPPRELADVVLSVAGVVACHAIRTRGTEQEVYADLHVLVDPQMSIARAHELADAVEERVKEKFPQVVEVLVHLEPATPAEMLGGDGAAAMVVDDAGAEEFRRASVC